MLNVVISGTEDMSDEELDAQLAMIIRAQCERGQNAVRQAIDSQFPDVPVARLRASTRRLAERGFAVSDHEWRKFRQ